MMISHQREPVGQSNLMALLGYTPNPQAAVKLCQNEQVMFSLLRLHGIPALPASDGQPSVNQRSSSDRGGASPLRHYCVEQFQQQTLGIYRADVQNVWLHQQIRPRKKLRFSRVRDDALDLEQQRVKYLAMRALYAVGLDFGTVYIGADSPTRVYVTGMRCTSSGPQQQRFQQALAKFVAEAYEQKTKGLSVMLGADPEFALRDKDGKMAVASDFLSKDGVVGCDSARLYRDRPSRQLPLVELRPKPSDDPDALFVTLCQALKLAGHKISDQTLQWIAGGMPFPGFPIGGHIHLSGVSCSFPLLRRLDNYVTLPLSLVEDEGCRKRRPRYGFLGDFRSQAHGGFEYRTLPSWLVHPTVARGVLALVKVVASNYWLLRQQPLLDVQVQRAYYRGEKSKLRRVVRELWQEMASLPMYHQYRHALQPLFHYLMSTPCWPAKTDLRMTWRSVLADSFSFV